MITYQEQLRLSAQQIVEYCKRNEDCDGCIFYIGGGMCVFVETPNLWDIDAIKREKK